MATKDNLAASINLPRLLSHPHCSIHAHKCPPQRLDDGVPLTELIQLSLLHMSSSSAPAPGVVATPAQKSLRLPSHRTALGARLSSILRGGRGEERLQG
ncbi:hypothetical protein CGCF413_v013964 [Colletotrichum fructicola]|nr:hypothetical protein CGCF413_v013964 [Colletotrichum fructicola]